MSALIKRFCVSFIKFFLKKGWYFTNKYSILYNYIYQTALISQIIASYKQNKYFSSFSIYIYLIGHRSHVLFNRRRLNHDTTNTQSLNSLYCAYSYLMLVYCFVFVSNVQLLRQNRTKTKVKLSRNACKKYSSLVDSDGKLWINNCETINNNFYFIFCAGRKKQKKKLKEKWSFKIKNWNKVHFIASNRKHLLVTFPPSFFLFFLLLQSFNREGREVTVL